MTSINTPIEEQNRKQNSFETHTKFHYATVKWSAIMQTVEQHNAQLSSLSSIILRVYSTSMFSMLTNNETTSTDTASNLTVRVYLHLKPMTTEYP